MSLTEKKKLNVYHFQSCKLVLTKSCVLRRDTLLHISFQLGDRPLSQSLPVISAEVKAGGRNDWLPLVTVLHESWKPVLP